MEKIVQSGKTPAGMHIPIMVEEILDVLQIQPGQTGYDATLGYGGHTRRMLEALQGQGHLYATDVALFSRLKILLLCQISLRKIYNVSAPIWSSNTFRSFFSKKIGQKFGGLHKYVYLCTQNCINIQR